jgi:hypothetical protein
MMTASTKFATCTVSLLISLLVVPVSALAQNDVTLRNLSVTETGGGRASYQGNSFVLDTVQDGWMARPISNLLTGDFHASSTFQFRPHRDDGTAGLIFDTSSSREPLADGAIFFGKDNQQVYVQQLRQHRWTPLFRMALPAARGEANDAFEISRAGNFLRFIFNGGTIGEIDVGHACQCAMKFYANGVRSTFSSWQVGLKNTETRPYAPGDCASDPDDVLGIGCIEPVDPWTLHLPTNDSRPLCRCTDSLGESYAVRLGQSPDAFGGCDDDNIPDIYKDYDCRKQP